MNSKRDNETQDAEVVAGDQKSLPEEEKEERQEPVRPLSCWIIAKQLIS